MSIQDERKNIEEHLKNGNYSKEQLIETILNNYENYAKINQDLSEQRDAYKTRSETLQEENSKLHTQTQFYEEKLGKSNERIIGLQQELAAEKEQSKSLGQAVGKRLSPEARQEVADVVKKDRTEQAKERLASMGKIRRQRVMGQMKEKYYTRHKENASVHVQASRTFLKEDVVGRASQKVNKALVPVKGKVGSFIQGQQKKIEARRRLSNIKRMKRQRARNEFLGKMNDKKQRAVEYMTRHAQNVKYQVAVKPVEVAQGFVNKMKKIKESYQARVQEAKTEVSVKKTTKVTAGKGR